jgi:uncharacterized membrane protein YjgN (DUF898 family)
VTQDLSAALTDVKISYTGRKKPLLKLALWTGFLTLITLGVYRFWARTRVRKYFWSAITPDDTPLEYNGTGLEKFLGFLIAVAVLVVYLGIVQLLLMFVGYSLFMDAQTVPEILLQNALIYGVAFVTLPLIYYAQYRARRYILSRTRWRGIRFGAEPAAWGYVKLAIKNLFFTIITLGIMLPRQTFNLEKYRVDRTYFGDAQFHQGGDWRMLRPAMTQLYIAIALILISTAIFFSNGIPDFEALDNGDLSGIGALIGGGILFQFGITWFYVGLAIYGVASWRTMANEKSLGGTIHFTSKVDTSDVIMAYIFGGMLAFFLALVVAVSIGFTFGFFGSFLPFMDDDVLGIGAVIGMIIGYLAFFIFFGAFAIVAIQQPILRSYANTITIHNVDALDEIRQRAGDDFVEAEGFADALDVGAAI